MADVQPLQGFSYTRDLDQVITPPFDVITPDAQARYYARNPYNSVRLELNQSLPTDNMLNNSYTRAAATFSEWRIQGILQQHTTPCYYLYQQKFSYGGQSYTRTSLLARVRLEDWDARVILPHEQTRTKDKEDRLNLLRACAANFSPIMCMYDDPQGRLRRLLSSYANQAETRVQDEAGEEHILHALTDSKEIALIQDFFAARQLYIADGHHRYTTALAYRDEIRTQRHELQHMDGANFVMMALIDVDDPGMLVLPTHRLLSDLPENALSTQKLAEYFSVQSLPGTESEANSIERLAQASQHEPSLLIKTSTETFLLSLNEQGRKRMQASEHSAAWNELDVAIVQTLVLEAVLGISADDVAAGRYIRYAHDTQQAFQALARQEAQALILLNGIPFRQVRDVALADDRMPQKSTYLYPKLITGLLINPLW